jgi:predicted ATP-grasp superfamily ATP-dependent carboligase
VIINVYTLGSSPPSAVAVAAEGFGGCLYVVDPDDRAAASMLPVLRELGPVVVATDPEDVARALGPTTPRGVVTFAERTLGLTARIAEFFDLLGPSKETVRWLTNKAEQRERLNQQGLGPVRSVSMIGGRIPPDVPLPAVIKPQQGAGSQDTVFVRDERELASQVRALPADRAYVIEELIQGSDRPLGSWLADYLSVETAVDSCGHVVHLGVTGRLPLADPARETGLVFPITLPAGLEDQVRELAEAAISTLEIPVGLVHTEVKLTDRGPVIIEVNGRLGGGLHRLMPKVGAAEPVALAIELAAGEDVRPDAKWSDGHALHMYVQPPREAAAVCRLPPPAILRALPGVFAADRIARPGDLVDWRAGSAGRVYDIWLEGDTLEALEQRTCAVVEHLAGSISWRFA